MEFCSFDLKSIEETISIVSDVLVTAITSYLFYKRFFSKGLYFSDIKISKETFSPKAIYVSVENRSLNPLIIRELHLIIDDKYRLTFQIEKPKIIEPYKLEIFDIQFSKINPDVLTHIFNKNMAILANTQDGFIYDMFCKKVCSKKIRLLFKKFSRNTLYKYKSINILRNFFNGVIINPFITDYIKFTRKDGSLFKEIFIAKGGLLSEHVPFLGNFIPKEITSDSNRLEKYLKIFASKFDLIVYHTKIPHQ